MSLAPTPFLSPAGSAAKSNSRPQPKPKREDPFIEGIDGPVELRRASGGYLQVWPRPTPESLRDLYRENFYEEDKSTYLTDVERDRAYWDATWSMRRSLMEGVLEPDRRRLLDVGCSGGFLLDHFAQHGWAGEGIEPSPKATAWARERFGLTVYCGELLEYPGVLPASVESGRSGPALEKTSRPGRGDFDAVHCAQVLEHVLDPEACVERMASLLAPGGVAYIEVPNDFNALQETARERLEKPAWWVAPDHHLNYFDYESLGAMLERFGLVEVDRLASFPIEMFLLMGEDYIGHPEVGAACHARRMNFERSLIESNRIDALMSLYRSLGQAGFGRTCGILARKSD